MGNAPREGAMLEVVAVGGLTALAVFFWYRWRDEKARAAAWRDALQFAQQEVTRWKAEAERWASIVDSSGVKLQETHLGVPNLEELLKRSSQAFAPRTE
jgi:hypothetical protein